MLLSTDNRIPRIIHYCWFGEKDYPEDIKKCIESWKILDNYQFVRWDESNCSFDENEFVKAAYKEKKYAFLSDYYRLKALYEYGGIYLDTDIIINKKLDKFLKHKGFAGFFSDCSIGTAVIGSAAGNEIIRDIIRMYDNAVLLPENQRKNKKELSVKNQKLYSYGFATNNYFFTYYFLNKFKGVKLNNKYQEFEDFAIYPKEVFEVGNFFREHYCLHLCKGDWRDNKENDNNLEERIDSLFRNSCYFNFFLKMIIRKKRYWVLKKDVPFYDYYLAQKRNKKIPEI